MDNLSRNDASSFLSKVPSANPIHHSGLNPSWTSFWTHEPNGHLSLVVSCSVLFQARSSPINSKTYQAATKQFYSFCTSHNVPDPFPLTEHLLCYFASYLATQDLAPQTIKSYLSAISEWSIVFAHSQTGPSRYQWSKDAERLVKPESDYRSHSKS